MKLLLLSIAGPLFLISFAGYVYLRLKLRKKDKHLDDIYYEFEEQDEVLNKYEMWSKITFSLASLSVLMLFLALVL